MRKMGAIGIVLFLLLSGCSAFFQVNLLKGLDTVSAPTASDFQGPGGLTKLATDLSSPAIVTALKADPAAAASIESYLQTTYLSGPLTTPDQQQAAVLYSSLVLLTTWGDQFVNNAVTIALGGVGNKNTVVEMLQGLIPAAVAGNPVAFAAMVEGLLNANNSYALLGASVPPAPTGMNMGDVAQKSAVAWMMRFVMTTLETSLSLTDSAADRSATEGQIYELLNNQPNLISSVILPDPYASSPGWLTNIFTAAGATLPT